MIAMLVLNNVNYNYRNNNNLNDHIGQKSRVVFASIALLRPHILGNAFVVIIYVPSLFIN